MNICQVEVEKSLGTFKVGVRILEMTSWQLSQLFFYAFCGRKDALLVMLAYGTIRIISVAFCNNPKYLFIELSACQPPNYSDEGLKR
jgi:hypothetical protein